MLITNVQIRSTNTDTRLEAVVSLTFDDMLVLHDIKVISSDEGYFLAMPSRKVPNDVFRDIAHPITKDVRAAFERIIIKAFERMKEKELGFAAFRINETCAKSTLNDQDISDFSIAPVNNRE